MHAGKTESGVGRTGLLSWTPLPGEDFHLKFARGVGWVLVDFGELVHLVFGGFDERCARFILAGNHQVFVGWVWHHFVLVEFGAKRSWRQVPGEFGAAQDLWYLNLVVFVLVYSLSLIMSLSLSLSLYWLTLALPWPPRTSKQILAAPHLLNWFAIQNRIQYKESMNFKFSDSSRLDIYNPLLRGKLPSEQIRAGKNMCRRKTCQYVCHTRVSRNPIVSSNPR